MAIDFGALVSRTFQILLRYKVLWVLGLIVTLLSTNVNFSYNANSFNRFSTASEQDVAALAGGTGLLACVAFILYVIFFFVRAGFEAGLIIASDRAAQDRPPTLQEAWALGRTRMWPIIGLNLIIVAIGLVVAIIFVILALVILGSAVAGIFSSIASPTGQPLDPETIFPALGGFLVCFCGFLLLAIPLFAVLGVVIQLAQRAVVLDNQGVGQAWSTGWQLFRANIGNVLLLLLIEFGIGILVAIVIGVISAAVSLPLTALALNSGGGAGGTLLGIVIGVILWVVTGVLGALPIAGNSVLWTLFYRILTVPAGAGPGQAALYPAGPPPGAYGPPPASPYGVPGGYPQPGPPPGGYTQPGQYPGGYSQPGQYPGGYSQPPGGYTQPGQYPGGYVPPTGASGGYGAPAPPAPGPGQPSGGYPPPAPPANPYGPPTGQSGYSPPPSGGEERARQEGGPERPEDTPPRT